MARAADAFSAVKDDISRANSIWLLTGSVSLKASMIALPIISLESGLMEFKP